MNDKLFRSPAAIDRQFLGRANLRGWPINLTQRLELYNQAQALDGFESTLSNVFSLDIWLGDLETTVSELWAWVCDVHTHWKWDGLQFNKKKLRFTKAVADRGHYGKEPFVRPVELNLGANRGKAPREVRGADSAGLEVMAAFALHTDYPRAIIYDSIPYVWLSALEATVPGDGRWSNVPVLGWDRDRGEVSFSTYWDDYASPNFSVPTRREL